jgi:peptidoglycan/xylan/chitin deacetylase (PgdA/CDA1 family)
MLTASSLKDFIKTIIPDTLLMHRLPRGLCKSILLTFDDGPDERITPQVLERLEKYNVRAVFFVIGHKVEQFPHILDMVVARGHVIGNHTYSHPYVQIPPLHEYRRDMLHCQRIVQARLGEAPVLYRSPAGILSISGLLLAKSLGLKTVLWSIEGGEFGVNKKDDAFTIGERLKKNLRPDDIVLLHDNNDKMPVILDIILPELKKRGIDLYNGVNALCS